MNLKCIDFFAGIGAWELASSLVNPISQIKFEAIEFIEINPQAQKVLQAHFPSIPIYDDVRSYIPVKNEADLYLVSFPCTGTSAAGKKTGLKHEESELWFEALRCIIIGRPSFIIVEQPKGFIDRGLRTTLAGLRMAGYETEVEVVSASECGAPHQRQRVFVIAYRDDLALQQRKGWTCWSKQIGAHIKIAREIGTRSEAESQILPLDDGVFNYLAGLSYSGWWKRNSPPVNIGLERRTPGRRECVSLVGRSIVPVQAAIALMRVQFLASLVNSH